MKKIIISLTAGLIINACSTEKIETTTEANTTVQLQENLEQNLLYKGIFTTLDSDYRAKVSIYKLTSEAKQDNYKSKAVVDFSDGSQTVVFSEDGKTFNNSELSFELSNNTRINKTNVLNASYLNAEASIKVAQVRAGEPLPFSYTGTYECTQCEGHPVLNTGASQTFNLLYEFNSTTGEYDISTQIILNGNDFGSNTGNTEESCEFMNGVSTCNISGSSENGAIEWAGVRATGNDPVCDGVSGFWSFDYAPAPTLLSGTFTSDNACDVGPTTLIQEDFEDQTVSYTVTFEDTASEISDYFRITDGTDIIADISNVQDTQFFAAQDLDGVGTNGVNPASLTWSNFDITGLNTFNFSAFFAEDDDGNSQDWDTGDYTVVQYSFDGTNWTTFFGIEADPTTYTGGNSTNGIPKVDTDLDGEGDGTEITDTLTSFTATFENTPITNPTGSTTISIRIECSLNSGDEDIAIDNIVLTGN